MKGVSQRGKIWWISYFAEGRRLRKSIGTSKKLAENTLHKMKADVAEGKHLDVKRNKKVKFKDFADSYYKNHSLVNKSNSTVNREISLLKKILVCFLQKNIYTK